jgi:NADPH:quinone reductase-like Zn-dependent oxidoreductase
MCCLTSGFPAAATILLQILKILGFLKLLELIYRVMWTIRRQLRTTEHLSERYGRGSWVIVTGGSDGIGLAMCKELALRDFNLVIVSRSMDKMEKAKE